MTDGFFAVGAGEWSKVCQLGLNPAVAFLVLACGTGSDNSTTRWSAEAVSTHTGMSWRRAGAAIRTIEQAKVAVNETEQGRRKRPLRKLAIPDDLNAVLWLPNGLVTGVGSEVPPLMKLRQAQNLEHLQAFIELYGVQDLAGDGGLPRSLVRAPFSRQHICDTGPFRVYGFDRQANRSCWTVGALAQFRDRKDGNGSAWDFLCAMEQMGLMETVDYLAEGDSPEAELMHPLTGDDDADIVCDAAHMAVDFLPGRFPHEADKHQYALPVIRHVAAPAVVGVLRLVYRPHTRLTAAWHARHRESCARFRKIYLALASADYAQAAAA